MMTMSYGRARLWLGILGVGSLVTFSTIALLTNLPSRLLADNIDLKLRDVFELGLLALGFCLWLIPFDFWGGYVLPKRHHKSFSSLRFWLSHYVKAATLHGLIFFFFANLLLTAGRRFGLMGACFGIAAGMFVCFYIRNRMMLSRKVCASWVRRQLDDTLGLLSKWKIPVPPTFVVRHRDMGFTGGIIGFGHNASIVIPQVWLREMSREQLATTIARRAMAIRSGSYARGLGLAFTWNLLGFILACQLPSAGVSSVAELANTFCGFTLWSFMGLLTLPTISRGSSLQLDRALHLEGVPRELIRQTAYSLDQLQDGEPHRPKLIETIFHPIPNVTSRDARAAAQSMDAWNVARTALFFSWACFGVLSRAVHCNVGRPELWAMLPTD